MPFLVLSIALLVCCAALGLLISNVSAAAALQCPPCEDVPAQNRQGASAFTQVKCSYAGPCHAVCERPGACQCLSVRSSSALGWDRVGELASALASERRNCMAEDN